MVTGRAELSSKVEMRRNAIVTTPQAGLSSVASLTLKQRADRQERRRVQSKSTTDARPEMRRHLNKGRKMARFAGWERFAAPRIQMYARVHSVFRCMRACAVS
jgi:hypothetical protein